MDYWMIHIFDLLMSFIFDGLLLDYVICFVVIYNLKIERS